MKICFCWKNTVKPLQFCNGDPFQLKAGNKSNVTIAFNGKEIDIAYRRNQIFSFFSGAAAAGKDSDADVRPEDSVRIDEPEGKPPGVTLNRAGGSI